MDTDSRKNVSMEDIDEGDDGEVTERRHRRDFVGTELERPKKNSRQRNKKRNRSGLDLMDDSDAMKSNSTMEMDAALPPTKKRAGPLGVRGATRSFNVLEDNEMTPEQVVAVINDHTKDALELAKVLAKYLWEPKVNVLEKCFKVFSRDQMVAWLEETVSTEKEAGMQTLTGERRKTPGGVFFTLIGRDASQEDRLATVGIPRSQRQPSAQHPPRAKATRTLKKLKPAFTPIDAPEEENKTASPLAPSKAKRNPFSLASSSTDSTATSSIFSTSSLASEDLGEVM